MKHLTYNLLVGLGMAMLSVSCSNVLDATPDGRLDTDAIYADAELTATQFSTCFNHIPHRGTRGLYFWTNGYWATSDEGWDCDESELAGFLYGFVNGQGSASAFMLDQDFGGASEGNDHSYYRRYYEQIHYINDFLEHIPTAAVAVEANRQLWTAEVYVLRAFFFLELIKRYGGLPIINQVLPLNYDYSDMKRESFADCARQVVADCETALQMNVLPWRLTNDQQRIRMTAAIACAVKSQAALFAASPLFNGGEDLWQWAYEVNKDSYDKLLANGYELYTTVTNPAVFGKNAYQELMGLRADLLLSPRDKETIWQMYFEDQQKFVMGWPSNGCFKAGVVPTQELVDAYDVLSTGKPVLDIHQPYLDEEHLNPNYNSNSGYDPENPYADRDPRMTASVLYNGARMYIGNDNQPATLESYVGGMDHLGTSAERKYTRTGYYLYKYINPLANPADGQGNGCVKIFRLAEIYLNLAECAIESGQVAEGIRLVNEIRHRAGFAPSVDISTGVSKEDARLYVHKERQVELSFEDIRYFDTRRWCNPGTENPTEKYITGMRIIKQDDGTFTYQRFNINNGDATAQHPSQDTYKPKYLLFPLPLNEAVRMSSITGVDWQNPGW